MARLSKPATPARPVQGSGTATDTIPIAHTSWNREGLTFTPRSVSATARDFTSSRASRVGFSPSKRIVSFDNTAPASSRRPMREETLAFSSPPSHLTIPGTPTRPDRGNEEDWQDEDDQEPSAGAGSGSVSGFAMQSTDGETDYSDLSNNSGFHYSPLMVSRTRVRRPTRRRQSFGNSSADSSYSESPKSKATSKSSKKSKGWGWHLNPGTPHVLASYLQLSFNLVMLGLLVYAAWMFVSTVRSDVNMKVEEYSLDILNEIDKCTKDYLRNNCQPERRVPALETICNTWDACMNRDPKQVGRARVSAETFGQIVNSFLAPIGIKAMIFLVAVFSGSFVLVNAIFASRLAPAYHQTPHPGSAGQPIAPAMAPTIGMATPMGSAGSAANYIVDYPRYILTPKSTRKSRR